MVNIFNKFKTKYTSLRLNLKLKRNFINFIHKCPAYNQDIAGLSERQAVTVFITPWCGTAVFHFSIIIGYFLKMKGYHVIFLFDDMIEYFEGKCEKEKRRLLGTLSVMNEHKIPIKLLSECKANPSADDKDIARKYAHFQIIHQLRFSGLINDNLDILNKYIDQNENVLPYVRGYLINYSGLVLIPGGICGNSGFFYACSKDNNNIKITSFDTGSDIPRSRMILGFDGVASHMQDMYKAYIYIKNYDSESIPDAIKIEKKELEHRIAGNSSVSSIKIDNTFHSKYDVLFVTNIEWDSAALGIGRVFIDETEWLRNTLEYLYKNTNAKICIRQHPHERRFACGKYLGEWLQSQNLIRNDAVFVSCYEDINTYQLIKNSKVVLPWTSTVGLEAAMLGKKVIVHTDSYYSKCDFITKCYTEDQYYNEIENSIKNIQELNDEQVKNAILMHFISQQCMSWYTHFLYPEQGGLVKILDKDWNELITDNEIATFIDCIVGDKLIPYVIYKQKLKKEGF